MKASTKPDVDLIFVHLFLEVHRHLDLIQKKWIEGVRRTRHTTPYQEALCAAKWALFYRVNEHAKSARDDGKLLFCFEGTTVLQGGAA